MSKTSPKVTLVTLSLRWMYMSLYLWDVYLVSPLVIGVAYHVTSLIWVTLECLFTIAAGDEALGHWGLLQQDVVHFAGTVLQIGTPFGDRGW